MGPGLLRRNGSAGVPTFRAIVAADIPTLNQNTTGTASNITAYTINQSVGTGNAPTFSGLTINGAITATGNITAYYSSDIKFKENIKQIDNALDKAVAIGGKYFDWKDSYIESNGGIHDYFMRKSDFGVIAQDVLANFPVAVRVRKDGTLAVDYEKLSALAFAAIAELKIELDLLKFSRTGA